LLRQPVATSLTRHATRRKGVVCGRPDFALLIEDARMTGLRRMSDRFVCRLEHRLLCVSPPWLSN
jgi:hypothetical protein